MVKNILPILFLVDFPIASNELLKGIFVYNIMKTEFELKKILLSVTCFFSYILLSAPMVHASALLEAVQNKNMQEAEKLILDGADVNEKGKNNMTPLIYAADMGYVDMVALLLKKGAEVNAQTEDGITAVMSYGAWVDASIIKMLLEHGANPNAQTVSGFTALMGAAMKGRVDIMQLLIEKGAQVNLVTVSGETALMGATGFGFDSAMELLLKNGAKVNAQNDEGFTALFNCVYVPAAHVEYAKILVQAGADVFIKDKKGRTAKDFAAENGIEVLVAFLEDIMEKKKK